MPFILATGLQDRGVRLPFAARNLHSCWAWIYGADLRAVFNEGGIR